MNPLRALFVGREMFAAQVVGIGKGKPGQTAEHEYIPDAVEAVVGHLLSDQQVEFRFGERIFYVGLVDLHLVIPERILVDPLVANGVEDKVFQTTKQVHRAVVVAVVRRLQKRIEAVDILVADKLQR